MNDIVEKWIAGLVYSAVRGSPLLLASLPAPAPADRLLIYAHALTQLQALELDVPIDQPDYVGRLRGMVMHYMQLQPSDLPCQAVSPVLLTSVSTTTECYCDIEGTLDNVVEVAVVVASGIRVLNVFHRIVRATRKSDGGMVHCHGVWPRHGVQQARMRSELAQFLIRVLPCTIYCNGSDDITSFLRPWVTPDRVVDLKLHPWAERCRRHYHHLAGAMQMSGIPLPGSPYNCDPKTHAGYGPGRLRFNTVGQAAKSFKR